MNLMHFYHEVERHLRQKDVEAENVEVNAVDDE